MRVPGDPRRHEQNLNVGGPAPILLEPLLGWLVLGPVPQLPDRNEGHQEQRDGEQRAEHRAAAWLRRQPASDVEQRGPTEPAEPAVPAKPGNDETNEQLTVFELIISHFHKFQNSLSGVLGFWGFGVLGFKL